VIRHWFIEELSRGWIEGDSPEICLKETLQQILDIENRLGPAMPLPPANPLIDNDPIALKWNYTQQRSRLAPKFLDPVTERQLAYMKKLAAQKPQLGKEMMHIVQLEFGENAKFENCTKGVAGFVIAALLGDIKPND
jgi:hypothetical protein